MNTTNLSTTNQKTQSESQVKTPAAGMHTQNASSDGWNPYFKNANRAPCELLTLIKDGLPKTADRTEDRLLFEAMEKHCENEIRTLADGFSVIGTLVSIAGQVADDVGISEMTLVKLGCLVEHLAVTLESIIDLRSDVVWTLRQNLAVGAK